MRIRMTPRRRPFLLLLFLWAITLIAPAGPAQEVGRPVRAALLRLAAVPDMADVEEITPKFAEASSALVAQLGGHSKDFFGPRKAIDNDWSTCWAEGVPGFGKGEWIKVIWLTKEVSSFVAILPGWAKNKVRYGNNPRPRDIELVFSSGFRQQAALEDRMQMQFVQIKNDQAAEWVKIVIQSVYPGKKFEDTSISEIKIFRTKKKG